MTVSVRMKQGGTSPQLFFSDSFARANKSTWGPNWIRTNSKYMIGVGNSVTGFATIDTNDAVMTSQSQVGASQVHQITWIPLPVYLNLYNFAGLFVQFTFRSVLTIGWGAVLRYNHDLNNTQTQEEGSDFYVMLQNGRIDKMVGGGAQVTIGAATWAPVANDVLRFECLTNGAQVTLQAIRNGAILQTINDATGTRILSGGLGMQINSYASTGTGKFRTFSCGPLFALSV